MALTNMHSDLRFNPSSGLCINLYYIALFYFASWGIKYETLHEDENKTLWNDYSMN